MEKWKQKLREWEERYLEGEITLPKTELWLLLMLCLMAGIVYGLRKAPLTHGMAIGSYNGNTFGCGPGGGRKEPEEVVEQEKEEHMEKPDGKERSEKDGKKHCGKKRGCCCRK